jgi:phosphoribosyl 1,2-cyclic phosphate phosphodiesterase
MTTLVLMGTGARHGVPAVGCHCPRCLSSDPHDSRDRSSALLRVPDKGNILIDCPPEFRFQALRTGLTSLCAILMTHIRLDHLLGIDDLRPFTQESSVPMFVSPRWVAELRSRFSYSFGGPVAQIGGGVPHMDLTPTDGRITAAGAVFTSVPLLHGAAEVLGYRSGNFAYLTDCGRIPDDSYQLLIGVDVLMISARGLAAHPSHFTFTQALGEIEKIRPKRAWLTHIGHECSHVEIEGTIAGELAKRPRLAGIEVHPGFDGLVVDGIELEAVAD